MNLRASNINVDNITVKDFRADVDFSNVKVEIIGGLPTFIPTEETERIPVEEEIKYKAESEDEK